MSCNNRKTMATYNNMQGYNQNQTTAWNDIPRWNPPSTTPVQGGMAANTTMPQQNMTQAAPQTMPQPQITPPTTLPAPVPDWMPETLTQPIYTPAFLLQNVGSLVRVEFLIGNSTTDRVGVLAEVGASYIVLQSLEGTSRIMCDLYSIKFVTIIGQAETNTLLSTYGAGIANTDASVLLAAAGR